MSNVWDADIDITAADAVSLIASQFPELDPVRLVPLGVGWDNRAFLVNETLVFRFPRRRVALPLFHTELRVLPPLSAHLPVPTPVPCYIGTPSEKYPYPFAGYLHVPGETACQPNWSDTERSRNAPALANFLSALHHLPLDIVPLAEVPRDTMGRADCLRWLPRVSERLEKVAPLLTDVDPQQLIRLAQETAQAPAYTGPLCWLHGDLYPRHLLVDTHRMLCGVIDWGDVHMGDPALDLSIAFTFLPPTARAIFRDTYGTIDPATWQRARFRAVHYGAALVEYAASINDAPLLRTGLCALLFASLED